jgi:selenide,water dikinase
MIPEAREYGQLGFVPAGAYRNREFRAGMTEFGPSVDRLTQDILFDPQTSGGLLICVPEDVSESLVRNLKSDGVPDAIIIGEVMITGEEKIFVE